MNTGIFLLNKKDSENKDYMLQLCAFLELEITVTQSFGEHLVHVKGDSPQFTKPCIEGEFIPQYRLDFEYVESEMVGVTVIPVEM